MKSTQIRRVFEIVNGGTPTSADDYWGGSVQWATPVDLGAANGSILLETQRTLTPTGLLMGSRTVPKASLILATRAPIGYVVETSVETAFNQGCRGLVPNPLAHARFYRYVLSAFESKLKSLGQGSTFIELSTEDLASLEVPLPPLESQRAIASYLDKETARIDALIEKKQRMAELFRQRIVCQANTAIRTADGAKLTGIPSLPTVPKDWSVLRNKVFMRETTEMSIDGTEEMLSVSHLTGVTPRSEKTVYMFEAESTIGYKRVQPGDLVINTMWAWMGAAGVAKVSGIVSPAYGVYSLNRDVALPEFIDIVIRTPAYVTEMTRFSRGVTSSRLRLYPYDFLSLRTPVPSMKIQKDIVESISNSTATSNVLIKNLTSQVGLLLERRQALITAAVTGQLEIPGVAA